MIEFKVFILQFLMAIRGVESNHGKDLDHRTISSIDSIHFGDAAIGYYAVMPNTLDYLKANQDKFKSNLHYQKAVAGRYALKVLQAADGCVLTASILWMRGPAADPIPADYQSPRFKRFIAEWEAISGPIDQDPFIRRFCK